jgi:hypothetical protein
MGKFLMCGLVAAALAVVVKQNLPEIKRYVRISRM